MRNKGLLFQHPVCGILLWLPEQTENEVAGPEVFCSHGSGFEAGLPAWKAQSGWTSLEEMGVEGPCAAS